ncbi:MAG: hypothetical protein CMI09_13920 [Oceanospirillaceae bacterium]|nr:hypothetical protein [Oceanospirillaceae bacterium]
MSMNILIPVDLAHEEELPVLIKAACQLVGDRPEARFDLLYVDDSLIHKAGSPHVDPTREKERRQEVKTHLTALIQQHMPAQYRYDCHVRRGSIHEQILEEAQKVKADTIVMMAQKPGIGSYFVGSNAERVVRHAHCSVMVLRS